MSNKLINIAYDQIPLVVINHPDTSPDHKEIMRALYKILKDRHHCIYSNESLSINTRIPERTLKRRLKELEDMGLICMTGHSFARRFSLGILLTTQATVAGLKLNTRANSVVTRAKTVSDPGHGGLYTKSSTKTSSKENDFSSLTNDETLEYQHYLKYPTFPLSDTIKTKLGIN